jgi:hypothetical protein
MFFFNSKFSRGRAASLPTLSSFAALSEWLGCPPALLGIFFHQQPGLGELCSPHSSFSLEGASLPKTLSARDLLIRGALLSLPTQPPGQISSL